MELTESWNGPRMTTGRRGYRGTAYTLAERSTGTTKKVSVRAEPSIRAEGTTRPGVYFYIQVMGDGDPTQSAHVHLSAEDAIDFAHAILAVGYDELQRVEGTR